jgi:cysteine desulfuration protein SufE
MADIPKQLRETLEDFEFITTRQERQQYLIQLADQFNEVKVSPDVAQQPYDESRRVPECESDAFVWATPNDDGTLQYHFDVLNPQGLSAMALSVVLGQAVSGAPLDKVMNIEADVVFDLFGREVSMGKGQGLMGIVSMVKAYAKQHAK